jgi:hypothetical protein
VTGQHLAMKKMPLLWLCREAALMSKHSVLKSVAVVSLRLYYSRLPLSGSFFVGKSRVLFMKKWFFLLLCLAMINAAPAMAKTKSVNDAVALAKSKHLIDSYDCLSHKAFVNELAWYTANYANKKMLAELLGVYCKEREGLYPEIHLYGDHSGYELGGLDMWGNMYVK